MGPDRPLPHSNAFPDTDTYVDSLLNFVGNHDLLRTLCGGVHLLDFFTSDPDLYSRILPQDWRDFFCQHEDVMNFLDLFMREDLEAIRMQTGWRGGRVPPASLLEYVAEVRRYLLDREPKTSQCSRNRAMKPTQKMARHVTVGMTVKKVHEVGIFASYVDQLADTINEESGNEISHLVDFGSGQSYLGRALASQPYSRNIVAIESKSHNAARAKTLDVMARLVPKNQVMRNKKAYRAGIDIPIVPVMQDQLPTPPPEPELRDDQDGGRDLEVMKDGSGTIQHVEHRIENGNLANVISNISTTDPEKLNLMVISLHSCGNLVHHGLRSLILNLSVKAVALVGCCYNLLTERLRPATYKLPQLRPTAHQYPRLDPQCDENGFPMSHRLCTYGNEKESLKLNITSRMMAVQAPWNWGPKDSDDFFTRHFYRAVLQRIFLDRGVVGPPSVECVGGSSPAGHSSGGTPIVIGSLRKSCYANFVTYVRGALEKLCDTKDKELLPWVS